MLERVIKICSMGLFLEKVVKDPGTKDDFWYVWKQGRVYQSTWSIRVCIDESEAEKRRTRQYRGSSKIFPTGATPSSHILYLTNMGKSVIKA